MEKTLFQVSAELGGICAMMYGMQAVSLDGGTILSNNLKSELFFSIGQHIERLISDIDEIDAEQRKHEQKEKDA